MEKLKKYKLLYVEDEDSVRKYAMSYFNKIFDQVFEAPNALCAIDIFKKEKPQIIITDIKMDNISGIELIKKIRAFDKECQIIILSAFLDTKYLLEAVGLNLVKYLTKPIKQDELHQALVLCADNLSTSSNKNVYFSEDCFFDFKQNSLFHNNEFIKLSQKEIELLALFSTNKNKITSYEEIENKIWYDSVMSENALRVLIRKLRKRLPKSTLENVPKMGYRINTL